MSMVLICVFACGLVFLLVENYRRKQFHSFQNNNEYGRVHANRDILIIEVKDPSLWEVPWRKYRPNVSLSRLVNNQEYSVHINGHGFRGSDIFPKQKNIFRIVCAGDSTTVEGATDQQTYPAMLEWVLSEWYGKGRLEVINAGISGLDSSGVLETLPQFCALEPDCIIYQSFVNDIMREVFFRWRARHAFLRMAHQHSLVLSDFYNRFFFLSDSDIGVIFESLTLQREFRFFQACASRGIPVVFCQALAPVLGRNERSFERYLDWYFTQTWNRSFSYPNYFRSVQVYNMMLKKHCAQQGLLCVPLGDEIVGSSQLFLDSCHMTAEGLRQKVDCVARYLKANLLDARLQGEISI